MKRSSLLLVVVGSVVAALFVAGCSSGGGEAVASQPGATSQGSNGSATTGGGYPARSEAMGQVTVEVKPTRLGAGEERNEFKVSFDTHSVELDFDFAKLMKLQDDLGNDYAAEAWTGGSGGHHAGGSVTFPRLKPGAKKVMLTISGIEGQSKSFGWELK